MDGIECVKKFRKEELQKIQKNKLNPSGKTYTPQIIIGISANSDDVTKQEALASGMDGFLSKPFEVEHLKMLCLKLGLKLFI